jgi:hypothetical protein
MRSLVTVADALLQLIRQRSVRSTPEAAEPRTGTLHDYHHATAPLSGAAG